MDFVWTSTILMCLVFMAGLGISIYFLGYRLSTSRCPERPFEIKKAADLEKWEEKKKNWKAINNGIGWSLSVWLIGFSIFLVLAARQSAVGEPLDFLALNLECATTSTFVSGEEILCRWVRSGNTSEKRLVLAKDFSPLKEGTIFTVKGGKFYVLEYSPPEKSKAKHKE